MANSYQSFTRQLAFAKLLLSVELPRGIDMGTRDYRWRERKKAKKGTRKPTTTIITPQVEVEVIKKGKKPPSPEE
jgi:hypothetical protein